MVFFNYSTMQMAAKIVYYGPGLCGKTTNLQYIYSRTADESRGEMVSLETETDRTLFFDLLPIDVGSIAGFKTRIQLYTVPGQVFYNTTRKLVLKGVDGVVFVADSQRPMLQGNIDSFENLEENLAEMGLSVDEIPLVLQYNKRDLQDISEVEDLNQALNRKGWPYYEASALTGMGVFETLKGISKLTLLNLKRRLAKSEEEKTPRRSEEAPAAGEGAPSEAPEAAVEPPALAEPAVVTEEPAAADSPAAAAEPATTAEAEPAPRETPPPMATPPPGSSPGAETPVEAPTPKRVKAKSTDDVLAELEKIRRQTLSTRSPAAPERRNGRHEISREIQLTLNRADFARIQHFLLSLQVEDGDHRVVDAVEDFQVDLGDLGEREKVLLRLDIALRSED